LEEKDMAALQHLIVLKASNFKRLVAVRVAPADPAKPSGVMRITGENGAGKSSLLDAIVAALLGKKYTPAEPVHKGADKAEVILETEDLTISRTFTAAGGGTLKVQDKEGRTYTSPQALLDTLCFKTGFDPLSFARMDDKKQTATLLEICPVAIDLEANAAEQKTAFDHRADLKRDLKREEAALAAWTPPDVDVPEAEIKVADLVAQADTLKAKGRDRVTLVSDIADTERQIEQIKEEIARKQKYLDENLATLKMKKARLATSMDPMPAIEALRVKIESAGDHNALFRSWETRRKTQGEIANLDGEIGKATGELETARQARLDALKAAKFPVEGLSLTEDGKVAFDDLPFSQAGTAEQIKVGIGLAVMANPTLRLAFIRDGSLLDNNSMRMLAEMAEAYDLQVLIERVDDKSPAAIEIVDGSTKEVIADA